MMMTQENVSHPTLATLALSLGGFSFGIAEYATLSILPYYSGDFGVPETLGSRAVSLYAFGVCVGAPLITLAAARMARRTLIVLLTLVFAMANALTALAPDWQSFLVLRFLAGLPHGAYFGVAGLIAASLVPPERRARAVALVMTGITLANLIGVPLANVFGAQLGWRWIFVIVVPLALACAILVQILAPRLPAGVDASPLRELASLRSRQVWLTLAICAIGTGGMFSVYTYLASILIDYTRVQAGVIPVMLMIPGTGMTCGQFLFGWLADRSQLGAAAIGLALAMAMMIAFWAVEGQAWLIAPVLFALGSSGGIGPVLQTRLIALTPRAPTLPSALIHSAFNLANAIGPIAGGIALAAGGGWPAVGLAGAVLAGTGLLLLLLTALDARPRRMAGVA